MENINDDRLTVYEIGYLLIGSLPEGEVAAETLKIRNIIEKANGSVIADEPPHKERLAYTMRKKTVAGSYEKYDEAYFGWIKFEVEPAKIGGIKKAVEVLPSVLRMLVITTVRENTFLGKRASSLLGKVAPAATVEVKEAQPASIEEMDRSIDEMVKEV